MEESRSERRSGEIKLGGDRIDKARLDFLHHVYRRWTMATERFDVPRCRIVDEEWDYIILLDATRYDTFERIHSFKGKLDFRYSAGSATQEFLEKNFKGEKCDDIVYVTGNPNLTHVKESFHKSYLVYNQGWNPIFKTALPQAVLEDGRKAVKRHPDKRIIFHFSQPHFPVIVETAWKLIDSKPLMIWTDMANKKISRERGMFAYEQNYLHVEQYAKVLADELDGKVIITSDHGNLFGEWLWPLPIRGWGHPSLLRHKALIKVPWFEVEK